MVTKDNLPATKPEVTDEVMVFQPPTQFEVIDRGPGEVVNFPEHGSSFVGMFDDLDEVTNEDGEKLQIARFVGADAKAYVIFPGASLVRGLNKLAHGQWARITYVFDQDTGKPSPMKCYTVEVGR